MTLRAEDRSGVDFGFDWEALTLQIMRECLAHEQCPYEAEMDLLLTTNEEIHKINLEYRGLDQPTDVLSFPLVDYELPGDFSLAAACEAAYLNPESGELVLGDMVLSADRVLEQAGLYGHSVKREFAFLITHSMFHLLGYDHMEAAEAAVMEEKQEAVLEKLGIHR